MIFIVSLQGDYSGMLLIPAWLKNSFQVSIRRVRH